MIETSCLQFCSAAPPSVHLHCLVLDGIYRVRLLKRVFEIDIEQCPECDGTLTILAAIEDPP